MAPEVVEAARPLSESILWRAERAYYERAGLGAWSPGQVPYLVTTGAVLARSYARMVEGFVADCRAGAFGPVDLEAPFYLIELGAGSGRLAFHLLRELDRTTIAPARVVYVLTDMLRDNLDFWLGHEKLRPLLDEGVLDVALYEAGSDSPLHLERSGHDLVPGEVVNPVAGIANYLLGALPQDLYGFSEGSLVELLLEVKADVPELGPESPDFFHHISVSSCEQDAGHGRYDERLSEVLRRVATERASGGGRFLFPVGALETIDRLAELASGRMLLLIGERPPTLSLAAIDELVEENEADGVAPEPEPEPAADEVSDAAHDPRIYLDMAIHGGAMSIPVDMAAIGTAVRLAGAELLTRSRGANSLDLAAVIAGDGGAAANCRRWFKWAIDDESPDDLMALIKVGSAGSEDAALDALLSTLRVGAHDPYNFVRLYGLLQEHVTTRDRAMRDELIEALEEVYERDFAVDESNDLAFGIGSLLGRAELWPEALEYFERSRSSCGERPQTAYNVAMCHLQMGEPEQALAALDKAIALDASYQLAIDLKQQLLAGAAATEA